MVAHLVGEGTPGEVTQVLPCNQVHVVSVVGFVRVVEPLEGTEK